MSYAEKIKGSSTSKDFNHNDCIAVLITPKNVRNSDDTIKVFKK